MDSKDHQEPFVVKHYSSAERPTIKGNGFDGLEVGQTRDEAEEFVVWINERLATTASSVQSDLRLAAQIRNLALEEAAVIVSECEWPNWAEGVDWRDVCMEAIRAAKQ